ncbi:facilitated trehalose transporter Tret1-like [Anopheles bellator]|uniref:facilitated trehalose transporter Tret1-like n=1 Tax=Anopheles bellator TaxID=139047 RepID=UPI0026492CFB|nr:facilitated trehalose transporter Tret1-like [Anopheles bellator]
MINLRYRFANQNQYIAALTASYVALSAGMVYGWAAPAGPRLVGDGEGHLALNSDQFSWAVAFTPMGAALVAIPCGRMLKSLGRKNAILFFVIPLLMGWTLLTFAQVIPMMYIGRLCQGAAVGGLTISLPIYIGEIANEKIRGTVGSFFQLMLNLGMLISFSVSTAVNIFQLNVISGFLLLIFGPMFMFMPETPAFLLQLGYKNKAIEVLKWLEGPRCGAATQIELLQNQQDALMNQPKRTLKSSLLEPRTRSALLAMIGLVAFLQLSGINAVLFYATDIFMNASDSLNYQVATIIVGAMQVVGTVVASVAVDRVGRRWLLMISGVIMCASHVTLGVYFHLLHNDPIRMENQEWVPVLSLSAFVTMFSVGFGPVPWIMIGEIFAIDIKEFAGSLAIFTNFGLSLLVTKTFNPLREGLGEAGTFWLFAGFCLLGAVFVFLFVPETKGKSFAQIQSRLTGDKLQCRAEK